MQRRQPKQFASWSFSRYSSYKQCPLKARLQHLDKVPEPKSPALVNGAEVHELSEKYLKGLIKTLPPALALFREKFSELRKLYKAGKNIGVEQTWAFTRDWRITRWDDWTGCWLRVKTDVTYVERDLVTVNVVDWKTGKFRADQAVEYEEQLDLYALGALLVHDQATAVVPRLVYLDAGVEHPEEPRRYTRGDLPRLKKAWEKRVRPMMNDTVFAPRPNDRCCWCFYRASNKSMGGGQCRY